MRRRHSWLRHDRSSTAITSDRAARFEPHSEPFKRGVAVPACSMRVVSQLSETDSRRVTHAVLTAEKPSPPESAVCHTVVTDACGLLRTASHGTAFWTPGLAFYLDPGGLAGWGGIRMAGVRIPLRHSVRAEPRRWPSCQRRAGGSSWPAGFRLWRGRSRPGSQLCDSPAPPAPRPRARGLRVASTLKKPGRHAL